MARRRHPQASCKRCIFLLFSVAFHILFSLVGIYRTNRANNHAKWLLHFGVTEAFHVIPNKHSSRFHQPPSVAISLSTGRLLMSLTEPVSRGDKLHGLLPDFEKYNQLHLLLLLLQHELPAILSPKRNTEIEERIFSDTTRTCIENDEKETSSVEVLSSREQVVSFLTAVRRLLQLSRSLQKALPGSSRNALAPLSTVNCTMILEYPQEIANHRPNEFLLRVKWETTLSIDALSSLLPSPFPQAPQASRLRGTSLFVLSQENDKSCFQVSKHVIQKFYWNDRQQPTAIVANGLKTIRQWVANNDLPVSDFPLSSFMNNLMVSQWSGWMEEQVENDGLDDSLAKHPGTSYFVNTTKISSPQADFPYPGTPEFTAYAQIHSCCVNFVSKIIPMLASGRIESKETDFGEWGSVFLKNTSLIGSDPNDILIEGSQRLRNYYQSLANFRRLSMGNWELLNATVLEWEAENARILVYYETNLSLPGSIRQTIQGQDIYTVERDGKISNIQQHSLSINGQNAYETYPWFMRSLLRAIESDRLSTTNVMEASSFWMELLRGGVDEPIPALFPGPSRKQPRSDAAALKTYRFMTTLHRDLKSILSCLSTGKLVASPPASNFLVDDVELRGYLNERLQRGKTSYTRAIGFMISSVRAMLQTGQLQSDTSTIDDDAVHIELKADENVRLTLLLSLRLKWRLLGGVLDSFRDVSVSSLPLKILIVSDYILDEDSGMVQQHRLVETKVNGQPTPTDLLVKWLGNDNRTPSQASVIEFLSKPFSSSTWIGEKE